MDLSVDGGVGGRPYTFVCLPFLVRVDPPPVAPLRWTRTDSFWVDPPRCDLDDFTPPRLSPVLRTISSQDLLDVPLLYPGANGSSLFEHGPPTRIDCCSRVVERDHLLFLRGRLSSTTPLVPVDATDRGPSRRGFRGDRRSYPGQGKRRGWVYREGGVEVGSW